MPYGLLSTGFVAEPLAQIQADLQAALQAQFGQDIDLSPTGPFGQLVGILADREGTLWQVAQAACAAPYPDSATGAALDDVCSLTGVTRLAATKSTGSVVLIGANATVVPGGSALATSPGGLPFVTSAAATISTLAAWAAGTFAVGALVSRSGNVYAVSAITTGTSVSGPSGTGLAQADIGVTWRYCGAGAAAVLAAVQAVNTGPVVAPAGTLTAISTPVSGLSAVTNALDIAPGTNQETDAALRLRRALLLQASGSAPVQALRAALLKVPGVTAAYVYENPTDSTDGAGRPPHSIECVVQGGTDAAVALAIWTSKAAGVAVYGTISQSVTDPATGVAYSVALTRPTSVPIYVAVTVKKGPTYQTGGVGAAAVAAAVVAEANGLVSPLGTSAIAVGQTIYASPLSAAVLDSLPSPNVLDVSSCFIGLSVSPTTSTPLTMTYAQLPVFDTSRVTVTET